MFFARKAGQPSIWSTASLKLAVIFSLLFGLGGAILIAALDYGLMRYAEAEVREGLAHQMAVMQADVAERGGAALVHDLNAEARNRDARRYLLLVEAADGSTFSNGLTRAAVNATGFRRNLPNKARPARWPDQKPNLLVLGARSPDGTFLAVGRDIQHLDDLRGSALAFAVAGGLALVTLAFAGGLILGGRVLRRLESVNRSVERIIDGGHSERLPAIGVGREFDHLAANLNRMLDRQEAALAALKGVSEGVAHELRAPLNRLRNRLEEALGGGLDDDGRQQALETALAEMDEVSALFESLLALSRMEAGAARLPSNPLDGGELMAAVGEIYRPLVEDAGGRLEVEVSEGAAPLLGDGSLLQQALANLIENAVRHSPTPPRITLRAAVEGDHVVLSVADRGAGIPAEQRARALSRFGRLDGTKTAGSGLGLTMAAAVARAHRGRLELTDNEPGLVVTMTLPSAGTTG